MLRFDGRSRNTENLGSQKKLDCLSEEVSNFFYKKVFFSHANPKKFLKNQQTIVLHIMYCKRMIIEKK